MKKKVIFDDPIVAEIHAIRARHAAECNNDLKVMFDDIMQHQKSSGRIYVALAGRSKLPVTAVHEGGQDYNGKK